MAKPESSTDSTEKQSRSGLFGVSCLLVGALILLGVWDPTVFSAFIDQLNRLIYGTFSGFYLWFLWLALLALILIGVSPLGRIKLGGPDAKPKHSYFSWFSMLFNAGMGTGIMFWGAAEPLYHFTHPPVVTGLAGPERESLALAYTFLHWGLGPWALYALSAIAIGFFGFNLQKGFRFSSFLVNEDPSKPEIRGKKPLTFIIDLVTILAVVFGVSSSMGMGTLNIEGGLHVLTGVGQSAWIELGLLAVMTVIFLVSACSGLEKGIKLLSNICLWVSMVLMACLLFSGPGLRMLEGLGSGLMLYLSQLLPLSLGSGPFNDPAWLGDWTVKYWSWWIAWAPFVGIFIALISKGRTIRQILVTVAIAPTIFSCLWFSIFGMAAIDYQITQGFSQSLLEFDRVHEILFQLLDVYTRSPFLSWLSLGVIVIFIANSADSAAYTISCLSCTENCASEAIKKPSNSHILAWGLLIAVLASVLLVSGGIRILEDVTTITVLPFALLLALVFITLMRDLYRYAMLERHQQKQLADDVSLSLGQVTEVASAKGFAP